MEAPSTSQGDGEQEMKVKVEASTTKSEETVQAETKEIKYFECTKCGLREKYEYFGSNPPFLKSFLLLEEAYVIEDPFMPPKQGEIIILGAHCKKCDKIVCKDSQCSMYFEGTHCISCAKIHSQSFPTTVQEKLNRILN